MAKSKTVAARNETRVYQMSGGAGYGRGPEVVWVNEPKRLETPFGMMEGYRGPHPHPFGFFAFHHSGWPVDMPDPIFEVKATARDPLLDFELEGGGFLVSEPARDFLLGIDSGAWTERAATVKFISRGKVQREERRYLMDVIRWLDALDYERSVLRIEDTPYGRYEWDLGGIFFKPSAIEGCAFFRRTGNQDHVYVISAARALVESSGFTGFGFYGGGDVAI